MFTLKEEFKCFMLVLAHLIIVHTGSHILDSLFMKTAIAIKGLYTFNF